MTNKIRTVVGLLLLTSFAACSSRTQLTPTTAKAMLTKGIQNSEKREYPIRYDKAMEILKLLTLSTINVKTGSYGPNNPELLAQRLLEAGYVVQSSENLTFPNISGTYKCGTGPNHDYGNYLIELTLVMQPGSPAVTGQYRYNAWYAGISNWNGPVSGTSNVPQAVSLDFGYPISHGDYRVNVTGSALKLIGPDLFSNNKAGEITFEGTGPGGSINVTRYSYAFSPKFLQLADKQFDQIKAGPIEVDSVDKLLLATETAAVGEFTWHVKLNEAGKILSGEESKSGKGNAEFGKQPDGTWVLVRFELNQP